MKDRLRSAQSRPCEIARFDLPHFGLNISIFLRRWAAAVAALMFSAVCSARGYIAYAPADKWSDGTNDHFLGTNKCVFGNNGLKDSPEELCQCHADRENRDVPDYRHDFIRFTMYPELWNQDDRLNFGQKGYCTYRIEYFANPAYTNEYTGPAVQRKYCLEGGNLSLRDGNPVCVKSVKSDLTLSFTRDKSRKPLEGGGAKIPLVATVTDDSTGSPVFAQYVDFSLSLPGGKLTLPGQSWPPPSFVTDANGQLLLDYSRDKAQGKTQVITASCTGCKEPVNLKIWPTPIVGFFNGVWNTDKQAGAGLQALEELIGPTYQGTDLRYENFYNQTGTGNGNTALQDIAEVFIQASPTLSGEHLLTDIDLVINGLRVQGISTVAPININLPMSKSDLSGHTLVGTYLDATRAAREKINGMVQAVLGKL